MHRWAVPTTLLLGVLACSACLTTVHRGNAVQSPMVLGDPETLPESAPAVILMRDIHLPRFISLPNTAYFVAVSKDRLRFHIELYHRWDTIADVSTWEAWLEDEDGTRIQPQAMESFSVKGINERLSFQFSGNVGPCSRQPCSYWLSIYRGRGDVTFYERDILRPRRRLTLVMKRFGYEFRYRWDFVRPDGEPHRDQRIDGAVGQLIRVEPVSALGR